jgi:hypothetical protein
MADRSPLVTEQTLGKVVKAAGELSLPGFSLYVDKHLGDAALHTAISVAAYSFLGPLGYVLVGVDSFTKSVSGRSLLEHTFLARPAEPVTTAAKTK